MNPIIYVYASVFLTEVWWIVFGAKDCFSDLNRFEGNHSPRHIVAKSLVLNCCLESSAKDSQLWREGGTAS